MTTRAFAVGHLASRLEVDTLSAEQGALFLLRRAALIAPDTTLEQSSPQEHDLAMQVSQELGGLLLALDQAGAYLEATGTAPVLETRQVGDVAIDALLRIADPHADQLVWFSVGQVFEQHGLDQEQHGASRAATPHACARQGPGP